MKLKICLIGDVRGNLDEGMKKITFNIYDILSKSNCVKVIKPLELIIKRSDIAKFDPDILHYVTGPSIFSLFLLKLSQIYLRETKTIISVTHPQYLWPKSFLKFFRPDLALVQTDDMNLLFGSIGVDTLFYPNGVDIEKFKPINNSEKAILRKKYNVPHDRFVILHVGNLRKGRNLLILEELSKFNGIYVLIVASTSIKKDKKLYNKLKKLNIEIITHYVENIGELYSLADAYLFPVMSRPYAVDLPLSVMEAMSCNIPVVSSRFGGLPIFFPDGNGLYFFEDIKDLTKIIVNLMNKTISKSVEFNTRTKVLEYSWKKNCQKLEQIYAEILLKR